MYEKAKLTPDERVLLRREIGVIAYNLKRLRLAAGLDRNELAERIRSPRQSVQLWESGEHDYPPPMHRLAQIALALGHDSVAGFFMPIPIAVPSVRKSNVSRAK